MARKLNFCRNRNFGCQIRNQRPKGHKNGWCSRRIAEKIVLETRHTVTTARGTNFKPVQHLLVVREFNMSKRSSTGVNFQPIYEPITSYFFSYSFVICFLCYFVIPGSRNQFGQKIEFCGRKLFDPASTKNAKNNF